MNDEIYEEMRLRIKELEDRPTWESVWGLRNEMDRLLRRIEELEQFARDVKELIEFHFDEGEVAYQLAIGARAVLEKGK